MLKIITDDIGSYPLPEWVEREEMERIALEIVTGEVIDSERDNFNRIVSEIMQQKINSGLKRPNYPQVQDMVSEFFSLIDKFSEPGEPWVVGEEFSRMPEIDSIKEVGKRFYEEKGKALELRICVTGPLEIYLKRVGNQIQPDLLNNLAKSVSRFVENSLVSKEYMETMTVAIDEPSLGLNPNIIYNREDLIKGWEIATKPARGRDVQIHLHSPNDVDLIYEVDGIGIIGVESAENLHVLDEIDKEDLELYDKFLRVGIARTNFNGIVSDYNEKFNRDVWKDENFNEAISVMESRRTIENRLKSAYKIFGDRILYAGPDCGLGSWPTQESALILLKNVAAAVDRFNGM